MHPHQWAGQRGGVPVSEYQFKLCGSTYTLEVPERVVGFLELLDELQAKRDAEWAEIRFQRMLKSLMGDPEGK